MTSFTKEVLNKYNIKLDNYKSQNYLVDTNKLDVILTASEIKDNETILEIGAGIGTLTIAIAKCAKKVIAIEKDKKIASILVDILDKENITNVEVLNTDALDIDFPAFDKVVSNLPYKISSPITFKLLKYPFKKAVLMYQYEFAKRMQASFNTPDYSRLSVALSYLAEVEIVDVLKPEAFIPQPKVNSAIVKIIPRKDPIKHPLSNDVLRALFQHRNKKSKKALIQSAHELNMNKKELKNKLDKIDNNLFEKKVFMLTPDEIITICNILESLE